MQSGIGVYGEEILSVSLEKLRFLGSRGNMTAGLKLQSQSGAPSEGSPRGLDVPR